MMELYLKLAWFGIASILTVIFVFNAMPYCLAILMFSSILVFTIIEYVFKDSKDKSQKETLKDEQKTPS